MTDYKILQIIPAPVGMTVEFNDGEGGKYTMPAACLALVEVFGDYQTYQTIVPVCYYEDFGELTLDDMDNINLSLIHI